MTPLAIAWREGGRCFLYTSKIASIMYSVVLITAPDRETAKKVARHVLEKRLAACVNMAGVSSMYWKAIHPYQVPEIIALPIASGYREYLKWVERETHA